MFVDANLTLISDEDQDMCPLMSLEAERFSFVSRLTLEITGQF